MSGPINRLCASLALFSSAFSSFYLLIQPLFFSPLHWAPSCHPDRIHTISSLLQTSWPLIQSKPSTHEGLQCPTLTWPLATSPPQSQPLFTFTSYHMPSHCLLQLHWPSCLSLNTRSILLLSPSPLLTTFFVQVPTLSTTSPSSRLGSNITFLVMPAFTTLSKLQPHLPC